MADPLTRALQPPATGHRPPASVPDDAVRLLRQAPLATLLCHWVGAAPLALALLLFRNQVTRPRVPASTVAESACVLAVLLLWMNCWRSVFAGRLRRQLSGAADSPWTPHRLYRLITAQAWFGATKLYVLPLSGLILFTAADTVAFYRIAAVLADRGELDPWQLRSRSRQIAASSKRENWTVLPILLFLQLLVAINFTLVLAALPQLFRIVTGIETDFSRSGMNFVTNPLFPFLVLAVSWLALDPFVQAVYCVGCFRAESAETGEDVRAGLRRIRSQSRASHSRDLSLDRKGAVALAAALLFLIALPVRAAVSGGAAVSPQQLDQAIKQTVQAHEYDWRLPGDRAASSKNESWIVDATDRAMASLQRGGRSLRKALGGFFKWLLRQFGGAPEPAAGAAPVTALHLSIYLLIGLLMAAGLWLAWQKRRAHRAKAAPDRAPAVAVPLDKEDLTPDRLPEEQWLEMAARCLNEQNFRLALRAFYLANLAWLGRTQWVTIHAGKTNREYELELSRKARTFPEARGLFAANMIAFERAWYGLHAVAAEDVDAFRGRVQHMKGTLLPPNEAAA
ncbi:MAG TPA: DUF4129 domain-containing protein [Candidatus Acidoferrales bacterium]|jgi:hypothetical protein|nr:DUF4129 domain-containing protein [Candidatus Acidoferrales bacterium]